MDVSQFALSYTSANSHHLNFKWNGQHAEQFRDSNDEFRSQVREVVLADMENAPLELIRDLFRAETQYSREAWGIVDGVGTLAEHLLRRGGTTYLDDFLEGKFQSFDASLGSAFRYDLSLSQLLLETVRQRIRTEPDSPKLVLWQAGEELFLEWVTDCLSRK